MMQLITQFDGGMVNDPRSPASNAAKVVTNFDVLTDVHRMVPYRNSESGDNAANTSQKQNFTIALRTGTTYRLYALGFMSGLSRAEVLMKDLTTSSTDLSDALWASPVNNQSAAGLTSFNLFVYYKKTGLIYGARASQYIWAFDPSSVAVWNDTERDFTSFTNIAQGLVHSKDDVLYIPYDNKIAKNDNGSWTSAALTLPTNLVINSICEDGNYLIIACAPISGVGNSIVFKWDRDSSLATLSESVDLGEGVVKWIEKVDGVVVCALYSGSGSLRFKDRVIFKAISGDQAVEIAKLIADGTSSSVLSQRQKINNRVYFMMAFTIDGIEREGVWSFGRSTPSAPFTIVHERTPNNDTPTANGTIKAFYIVGDYIFQSYTDNSGTYGLSKTNDTELYTNQTAVWESRIFNEVPGLRNRQIPNSSEIKKLIGVTVMTEYMPSNGNILVAYKKDSETSWTTIFTDGTDNSISHSAVNTPTTNTLPEYKEIRFRIESTGGAVVTGFSFDYEVTGKRTY